MMKRLFSVGVLVTVIGAATAQASPLTLSITDRVGDFGVPSGIDLTGVVLNFDNATGAFTVVVTATPAHPFLGSYNFNLNLYNPSAGTTSFSPGWFRAPYAFAISIGQTSVTYTGVNAGLMAWDLGDQVAYDDLAFGSPTGVLAFRAGIGGGSEDYFTGPSDPSAHFVSIQAQTQPVPEPASLLLLGTGLIGAVRAVRRKRG